MDLFPLNVVTDYHAVDYIIIQKLSKFNHIICCFEKKEWFTFKFSFTIFFQMHHQFKSFILLGAF